MASSWFLKPLLLSMLLLLSFSQGFSRKVMETVKHDESKAQFKDFADGAREMAEIMDYRDPGPNLNPRTGYILSPPSQG